MKPVVVAAAMSVLLHGAGAFVVGTLGRGDTQTPLPLLEVILADLGGATRGDAPIVSQRPTPTEATGRAAPEFARAPRPFNEPRAVPEAPVSPPSNGRASDPAADLADVTAPQAVSPPFVEMRTIPPPRPRDAEGRAGRSGMLEGSHGPTGAVATEAPRAQPDGAGWADGSASGPRTGLEGPIAQSARAGDSGPAERAVRAAAPPEPSIATPRYQDNAKPAYPWLARVRGEEGRVLLSVLVDVRGRVGQVRVERSSGSKVLDDAALDAIRRWTFDPARQGTQPMEAWVKIPVDFRLEDSR